MNKIAIIDYGVGNIGSIQNMISRLSAESYLVNNPIDILKADKIILPGVGHFDHGMKMLQERKLIEAISEYALVLKKPILGICLGAQLMTKGSDEGESKGLCFFDAEVRHFSKLISQTDFRVPHMGWNEIKVVKDNLLCENLPEPARFYFVHSYYLQMNDQRDVMTTTTYGLPFTSGIQKENIYAVQFHPEKSHKYGLRLMNNFIII